MADFVIKPGAGVSNKLILQTQDATDVLTTSASGVTLASATLNSPTLVTPALGTVATGNLSNTAIVYPAGHVLQVVQGTDSTENGTTSTGFVPTGIDVSITPSATSSKILIFATTSVFLHQAGHVGYYTIYRDTTPLSGINGMANLHQTGSNSGYDLISHINMAYLDSPSTTSATTYQIYARVNSVSLTTNWSQNGSLSTIICQEIAG